METASPKAPRVAESGWLHGDDVITADCCTPGRAVSSATRIVSLEIYEVPVLWTMTYNFLPSEQYLQLSVSIRMHPGCTDETVTLFRLCVSVSTLSFSTRLGLYIRTVGRFSRIKVTRIQKTVGNTRHSLGGLFIISDLGLVLALANFDRKAQGNVLNFGRDVDWIGNDFWMHHPPPPPPFSLSEFFFETVNGFALE